MGDLQISSIIFMAVVWVIILLSIGLSLYALLRKKK